MKLSEIRADYPMYSDLSDAQFVQGFHKKFYSDLPFRDFSKKIGYLQGAQPEEYDPASPEFKDKYGATSGMSGGQRFLAGIGKGMTDMVQGAGQAVGAVSREDVAASRALDAPLMETRGGKLGSLTGAVATAAPAALIPGANTLLGAGLIGGGMGALQPSTSTKETLANTALGGVLSPAGLLLGRGASALYRGGKATFIDPFTKAGQNRMAANTFQNMAGGADSAATAAQNIRTGLADTLPGAQPTAAELGQNAGLAQLERTLKNNPEFTNIFADRAGVNRNAITGALDNIAGDESTRAAASLAREAGTKDLYQAATRATYQVDDELANILGRPAVRQAMTRAENLAANQGRPFSFSSDPANPFGAVGGVKAKAETQITGQGLQDLKMAMDEMLSDPSSGFTGKAGDTIKTLRGQIVGWMEKANPDFKAARTGYAELSKPLNQMDIGQVLRDKLLPAMTDYGAQTPLRPASFAQAMRNGDATAANVMGRATAKIDDVMAPEQMNSLRQVGEQLARRSNADNLGRAVGSNTVQNLAGQNSMRQMLGPLGLPQNWVERMASSPLGQGAFGLPSKLAEKATGTIGEPNVLRKLVEIGLSPEEAIKVLEQASKGSNGLVPYYQYPALSGANAANQ